MSLRGLTDGRGTPLQVCVACELKGITHVTNRSLEFRFAVGLRFYIASSLANAPAVDKLTDELKAEGHIHTYCWSVHGPVFKDGATRPENVAVMASTAEKEEAGVATAEVLIVMLPGGKGTHVELGMALAAKKPVIIAADRDPYYGGQEHNGGRNFPCAFWFHPLVRHVEQGEVVKAVRNLTVELRAKAYKEREAREVVGSVLGIGSPFGTGDVDYSEAAPSYF